MKKLIRWLIKTFLKGYSLHRNPPKGQKRPRVINFPSVNLPINPFAPGEKLGTYINKGE
jgi:hypothetical protein